MFDKRDAEASVNRREASGWGHAVFWPVGARWRGVLWFSAIFCAYVGLVLLFPVLEDDGVALLWLPNAVLVTALLRFRMRDWPYVYAAGLLAEVIGDLTFGVAPHQALYVGAVNVVEATLVVLCAALIAGGRNYVGLLSVRGAWSLAFAAIMVPALTGALGAVGVVWAFDVDYFAAWRNWWFGDALGLLLGVPIGLLLRDSVRSVARYRPVSMVIGVGATAGLLVVLSALLAVSGRAWSAQQVAIAIAVLVGLTFGTVGVSSAAVVITAVTLVGLSGDVRGLASILRDQVMLFVVFGAMYAIAAATESGNQTMRQLIRAREDVEKLNERLAFLSRTDELTGLSNRRVLSERLDLLWAWCVRELRPVAMLMVDIDCFHQYNEAYGHVAGDTAISRIASVVRDSAQRKTDLVVRYGGEEFLIVFADATFEHARESADRIHKQVRDLNIEHSRSWVAPIVTVSIGVLAVERADSGSAINALECCDALLYKAKETGRNRTVAEQLQMPDSVEESSLS